jgi:hypothetical protein
VTHSITNESVQPGGLKMSTFAESLVAGQLTFASNMVAWKHHVVRLRRNAFDDAKRRGE